MEIYIEDIFINNFLITLIFLFLSKSILKQGKISMFILASIFASLCSIFYPMITLNNTIMFFIKIFIGIIINLIAFNSLKLKKIIFSTITFFIITFIFGGICIALKFNFNSNFSLFSIVLIIIAFAFFVYFWIESNKKKNSINQFVFQSVLICDNKRLSTNGFLDTGNMLFDDNSEPIVVITIELFTKLFDSQKLIDVLAKKTTGLKDERYINCGTVNNQSKMLVFRIDNLIVKFANEDKKFSEVNVGLSFVNFKKSCSCDLILNPTMF